MMTVAVAEAGTTPSAPRGFQAPPGAMAPAAVGNTVLAPQATASQMASTVAPSLHRGCKIYNVFREQDLNAFLCVVASAAQVEACLSLGLGLLLLFPYMVETRLEKRDKPRKRRSAVRQNMSGLSLTPTVMLMAPLPYPPKAPLAATSRRRTGGGSSGMTPSLRQVWWLSFARSRRYAPESRRACARGGPQGDRAGPRIQD